MPKKGPRVIRKVTEDEHRRALQLVRDRILSEVQQSMATGDDMAARHVAAGLPEPDSVQVLYHAAGIFLGVAAQIKVPEPGQASEVAP